MARLSNRTGLARRAAASLRIRFWQGAGAIYLWFGSGWLGTASENLLVDPPAISISKLQNLVAAQGQTNQSFRLAGVVCAMVRESNLVALQDESGCALLQLPELTNAICIGDSLSVVGQDCPIKRCLFGLQVGSAPVINNDGRHAARVRAGCFKLCAGHHPIRLAWFNAGGESALKLEYEGPGLPRQPVPDRVLWRSTGNAANPTELVPGLDYTAYNGSWYEMPEFDELNPITNGIAARFDLTPRARQDDTGLLFRGFLEIASPGDYTFYLTSDDGGQFHIGDSASGCEVIRGGSKAIPTTASLEQALAGHGGSLWTRVEGVVTFASQNRNGLDLELAARGERVQATVIHGVSLVATNLLNQRVRLTGICETSPDLGQRGAARLLVPGVDQVEFDQGAANFAAEALAENTVLTTAEQVRRLGRDEARRGISARIQGVVTWVDPFAVVLQDASGGVYVRLAELKSEDRAHVGEVWVIEGPTDPGDFSPIVRARRADYVGHGSMPEPIRPTWDQLMNGSLDAEYVELRGVLTAVAESELTLLTSDGAVTIRGSQSRPVPRLPSPGSGYVDSVVRIRGCFTAQWDTQTKRVRAGEFFVSPSIVNVDEPRPVDPFAVATRKAGDLLYFDAHASVLQRIKIAGQILYTRPHEHFLLDGQTGLRCLTKEPAVLRPGDLVEAVGFPQLGGPSPVLQEAQARKTGHAPFPEPTFVPVADLLNRGHDSTLVKTEAMLVSDTANARERVLELQAGPSHFLAKLRADENTGKLLAPGTRVQLTGVYASVRGTPAEENLDPFELLLNGSAAITVLQQPSWWTGRHAMAVVSVLGGAIGIASVWITLLRRKVEERTRQLQREIEERHFVEQRRAMEEERARVAQDLHDDLGAGLTEVGILGALAKNPSLSAETKDRYLDRLTEAAHSLVTALDEIVWAVNPHYDSVASLASYYSLYAQRFLNLAGTPCRLQVAEQFPEYPLDSRLRHGIFLAFKEALNNIVRHSHASEVGLTIEVAREHLMISITDNGRGFGAGAEAPGKDGLASMQQRLQKLGGQCRIDSRPGRGTIVEFRLALEKNHHDQSRHR